MSYVNDIRKLTRKQTNLIRVGMDNIDYWLCDGEPPTDRYYYSCVNNIDWIPSRATIDGGLGYFGEIVLWVGIAIIALPVLSGWQWATLISPIFVTILLTKISGVPMLEKRADEKWGGHADYEAYKKNTSVLIPMPPKGK